MMNLTVICSLTRGSTSVPTHIKHICLLSVSHQRPQVYPHYANNQSPALAFVENEKVGSQVDSIPWESIYALIDCQPQEVSNL